MTKREQIWNFIREAGSKGRSFTEIQRFIVELNGLDYDERDDTGRRRYRGYYCSSFFQNNWAYRFVNNEWVHPTAILSRDNWVVKNKFGRYFAVDPA